MTNKRLPKELQQVIARACEGLKGHRDQFVLVGGLAKFFYALHPDFVPPNVIPRATVDLDLALTNKAMKRRQELHHGLISNRLVPFIVTGFDGRPVEMQYQRIEDGSANRSETCVEFVVPYLGEAQRPKPADHAVMPSALRFVELLLIDPVRVEDPELGPLLLPHPLSYIAQKMLMRDYRRGEKQPRDQADCVYVAWGFQPTWPGWATQWTKLSAQPGRKRWLNKCRKSLTELYQNADAIGSREVELVYSQLGGEPLEAALAARIMNDLVQSLA